MLSCFPYLDCNRSYHFFFFFHAEVKKHDEGSGSGYDEYDESGSASLYYADEVSGSGSSDYKEDEEEGKTTQ